LSDNSKKVEKATLWDWVKATCTLVAVGVICYKIYLTPIELTVDFPTLLSLLLALFSVGLAALFYFKATETSNTFYDNTYNFTKDIAQLLAKIESGFGEKLRNLDEGYSSVRDYIQNSSSSSKDIDETKQKIEGEKQEIEKAIEERNKIVRQLLEQSQLQEEEKEAIAQQLAEKEQELEASQKELSRMNKKLFVERMKMRKREEREIDSGMEEYTKDFVIRELDPERVVRLPPSRIRRMVDDILNKAPHQYIEDLERHGFFDNGINSDGMNFIRRLAKQLI
jgi:flagellar biosynthesis GTPase FlhF